ncbi:MAGUK p55 subfamily member 7-like [Liolophura sinensis]|uniref:MAGUK p55 subfamily member 7-like n=1 Tax=Liolophura sinensis TaxID=3198878 RepID=UPI00315805C7
MLYMDTGVAQVGASLDYIQHQVKAEADDIGFLKSLLFSQHLHKIIPIYRCMEKLNMPAAGPYLECATGLTGELLEDLSPCRHHPDVAELIDILSYPHMLTLLCAHDSIACKDYDPRLPPIPLEVDEDDEVVKVVKLIKNNEPLGATIHQNEITGVIEIARVMKGGAADRSGLIHVGDQVCEVNGISVQGKTPDDILEILTASGNTVTLKLYPAQDTVSSHRESTMKVRALFDYIPIQDELNPCPEASLSFSKGDILHVVCQEDSLWWQAKKRGDNSIRAGLIPSRHLQERRRIIKLNMVNGSSTQDAENSRKSPVLSPSSSPGFKQCRRLKKMMYYVSQNPAYDLDEVVTYEEVELSYPVPGRFRPIVLIGAPGVGRNELKRRLIGSKSEHFQDVVPYTSRPRRHPEQDGKDYNFVSREEMEKNILLQKFAEYGEYKGHLYGTSLESIRSVVTSGKVCVLTPHTQALKFLRTREIQPFIILVKPPILEVLRESRRAHQARATIDENQTRPFTDADFEEMLSRTHKIQNQYGHYFDYVIINDELTVAVNELIRIAHSIENEPQWVPLTWIET